MNLRNIILQSIVGAVIVIIFYPLIGPWSILISFIAGIVGGFFIPIIGRRL